jgi:hypothetical protein
MGVKKLKARIAFLRRIAKEEAALAHDLRRAARAQDEAAERLETSVEETNHRINRLEKKCASFAT